MNAIEPEQASPDKRGRRSVVYLILWLAFIFITSSVVIRPQELYSIVQYCTGASDESLEQFKLFWIASWFAIVKGWHFAEFAMVTLLANKVIAWIRKADDLRTIALSMTFATAYAISDEWHQSFVPDRIGSVEDVVIDCLGIGAAGILLASQYFRKNRQPT